MKNITTILAVALLVLNGCSSKKVFQYEGKEYWGKHHAGNTTTIQQEYKVYTSGSDTIIHYTNYYQNGKLKSKVIIENDRLLEIELVVDTLGKPMNFGQFKNGNGYVVQYSTDDGSPEYEGQYINGNKEGWWKRYHFSGSIMDSTLYKEGFPQYDKTDNLVDELIDVFGPLKNNMYR